MVRGRARFRRRSRKVYRRFRRPAFRRSFRRKSRRGGFRGGVHKLQPAKRYGGLFPSKKLVTLRWTNTLGSAASGIGVFSILRNYAANSAWDPDITGIGYSAKGYKFFSKYYGHATVIASKINVKLFPQGSPPAALAPMVLCMKLDDDGQYFGRGDYRDWSTDPLVKTKFYPGKLVTETKPFMQMSMSFSAKKFFGVKNVMDNTERIGSAVNALPMDGAHFVLALESADLVQTIPAMMCITTIDYKVMFTELSDQDTWTGMPAEDHPEVPEVGGGDPIEDSPTSPPPPEP